MSVRRFDRLIYSLLGQTDDVSHTSFDDFVARVASLSAADLWAVETTDGLAFEACMSAGISPFVLLGKLKSVLGSTRQQIFFSGQYALSRHPQHDTVVARCVETVVRNGVDAFRVYDPMNDVRNVAYAVRVIRALEKECIGHLFYISNFQDAHEKAVASAQELVDLGCDSIVLSTSPRGFFDPAGLMGLVPHHRAVGINLIVLREMVADRCGALVGVELDRAHGVPHQVPMFDASGGFRITNDLGIVASHLLAQRDV